MVANTGLDNECWRGLFGLYVFEDLFTSSFSSSSSYKSINEALPRLSYCKLYYNKRKIVPSQFHSIV